MINTLIDQAFGLLEVYVGQCNKYDNLLANFDVSETYKKGNIVQWNSYSTAY